MHSSDYIQRLSKWFVAEPGSVPAARRAAEDVRGVLGTGVSERVCLLVSELIANAVTHGSTRPSDTVRLRIWTSPTSVRVAVSDRGRSLKWPPPRRDSDSGGLGLLLVARLADRWGIDGEPETEVWFEVDAPTSG